MKIKDIDFLIVSKSNNISLYVYCLGLKLDVGALVAKLLVTDFTTSKAVNQKDNFNFKDHDFKFIEPDSITSISIYTDKLQELVTSYEKRTSNTLFDETHPSDYELTFHSMANKFCILKLLLHYSLLHKASVDCMVKGFKVIDKNSYKDDALSDLLDAITTLPNSFIAKNYGTLMNTIPDFYLTDIKKPNVRKLNDFKQVLVSRSSLQQDKDDMQDHITNESKSIESGIQTQDQDQEMDYSQPHQINIHNDAEQSISSGTLSDPNSIQADPDIHTGNLNLEGSLIEAFDIDSAADLSHPYYSLRIEPSSNGSLTSKHYPIQVLNLKYSGYPDNKVYKIKGYLIGHIPQSISHLCTKKYEVDTYRKKYVLTDPSLRPLELFISDVKPNSNKDVLLNQENSIGVVISDQELLDFFNAKSIESFYIHIHELSEKFYNRKIDKLIEFSLYKRYLNNDSQLPYVVWSPESLKLDDLL